MPCQISASSPRITEGPLPQEVCRCCAWPQAAEHARICSWTSVHFNQLLTFPLQQSINCTSLPLHLNSKTWLEKAPLQIEDKPLSALSTMVSLLRCLLPASSPSLLQIKSLRCSHPWHWAPCTHAPLHLPCSHLSYAPLGRAYQPPSLSFLVLPPPPCYCQSLSTWPPYLLGKSK